MLDDERKWLFITSDSPLEEDLTEAAGNFPPEANAVLVYPKVAVPPDYQIVS